jgi:hypothetical protein
VEGGLAAGWGRGGGVERCRRELRGRRGCAYVCVCHVCARAWMSNPCAHTLMYGPDVERQVGQGEGEGRGHALVLDELRVEALALALLGPLGAREVRQGAAVAQLVVLRELGLREGTG